MRRNLLAVFVLFIGRKTGGNTKVRRGSMISLFLPYTCTVSPENQYSLNNALASGFEIVCRREMYGGYDRYLLAKAPLRHLR